MNERNRDPELGDKLSNATVMRFTLLQEASNGWRRNGVALCVKSFGQSEAKARRYDEEFVTWRAYRDEQGEWHAEHGHYYFDFFTAVESYRERGGK